MEFHIQHIVYIFLQEGQVLLRKPIVLRDDASYRWTDYAQYCQVGLLFCVTVCLYRSKSTLLQTRKYRRVRFSLCFTAKVSEEVNRKGRPRNRMAQFSTLTTAVSATIHSETDGQTDRQTGRQSHYANDRSYCVTVPATKVVFWSVIGVRANFF